MKRLLLVTTLFAGCELGDPNPDLSSTDSASRISETALAANFLRIRTAASKYRAVHGSFPDSVQALVDEESLHPGQELDPWGTPFVLTNDGGVLVITTYGADKKPGGENANADRVSDGVTF